MKNIRIIFLILILGLLFRLPFILISSYQIDYDNCTIGLMARHILQGNFPVFFYGQAYMGSIEAFVAAFFFFLFNQSGYVLMFSVLSFYVLFIISTYYLGSLIGNRKTGLYAILYSSFGPCYFLIHTYAPRGGYIETLFFGTLLLALSLKIADRAKLGLSRRALYLVLGFISGLAFWTHFLIVYYLVAVALFLVIIELKRIKIRYFICNVILSAITFILGSLPLWIYNIKNGFPSFVFKEAIGEKIDSSIMWKKFVFSDLRSLLGFEFIDLKWFNYLILCIYSTMGLIFLWILLKGFIALFYRRISGYRVGLIFLFLVSIIYIYTTNHFALLDTHKYLLPIFSLIPIAIGYVSSMLHNYKKYLGFFIMALIVSFNITGSLQLLKKWAPEIKEHEREYKALLRFCSEKDIDRIITPLWDSYYICFFSKEKIICQRVRDERLLSYALQVERADSVSLFSDPGSSIPNSLKSIGCTYQHKNFGKHIIWHDIKVPGYWGKNILPVDWSVKTNFGSDLVNFSFNRNMDLIWTSVAPKKDDMWFLLDMNRVYKIFKLVIYNGDHIHNYTGNCKIELSLDGKKWDILQEVKDKESIFTSGPRVYWHQMYGRWEVVFNPREARYIRLSLLENNDIHPWEVNEFFVYEYKETKEIDYNAVLPDLAGFLKRNDISFVYADFWLSAKLKEHNIQTLNPVLDRFPKRIYVKRDIVLKKNIAFVVDAGEINGLENILTSYNIIFNKEIIDPYVIYYFDSLPIDLEGMPGLLWGGGTILKGNFKDRSWFLYKLGERLIKREDFGKAIEYLKESIDYYSNNIGAYYRLAELYMQKGNSEAGNFYLEEYKLRTKPEIKRRTVFEKDIEFLGFSIDKNICSPGDTITIDYYWKIKRPVRENLFVFVHFIKDEEVVFQNDHPFLGVYPRHLAPFKGEIFWERFKIVIPEEIMQGNYSIILGLWDPGVKKRFKIIEREFHGGSDYIELASIKVIRNN